MGINELRSKLEKIMEGIHWSDPIGVSLGHIYHQDSVVLKHDDEPMCVITLQDTSLEGAYFTIRVNMDRYRDYKLGEVKR